MTVSLTNDNTNLPTKQQQQQQQQQNVAAPPPSYVSTRSAAMMALTFGQRFRNASPSNSVDKEDISSRSNSPIVQRRKSVISSNNSNSNSKSTTPTTKSPIAIVKAQSQAQVKIPINATNERKNSTSNLKTLASSTVAQQQQVNGVLSAGSSSGSDNDGGGMSSNSMSSSATALRRFYFKSGRKSKTNFAATGGVGVASGVGFGGAGGKNDIPMNIVSSSSPNATGAAAFHTSVIGLPSSSCGASGVPKLVVMGSSASVTNISTSTDSASTLITNVTHTDDSLDLGDNSGQSEPLFSSLEEPLLTAIQIDSEQEHGDTELELTNCPRYSTRSDVYLQQDSVESQESCLSIPLGEATTTTPLLTSHAYNSSSRGGGGGHGGSRRTMLTHEKQRLPNTAPAPTNSIKHFTFDMPHSPKSARTTNSSSNSGENTKTHFTFKEAIDDGSNQRHSSSSLTMMMLKNGKRTNTKTNSHITNETCLDGNDNTAASRQHRDSSVGLVRNTNVSRNQINNKTSPKRSMRRSPCNTSSNTQTKTASSHSKVNSAPPTMKDGHFFAHSGRPKQSSPLSSHAHNINSRKYSSSSSSGGSERERERERNTMFPFDREAIDYERIQRECFAVDENSSSTATSSDSEEGEACSVYERRLSPAHHSSSTSPKSADIFQQYKLLTQQEQQQQQQRPPSRKNSKRMRPETMLHMTSNIQEKQKYLPPSDAFQPQPKSSTSPGELSQSSSKSIKDLNKFDDIAMKFEQIPPKHALNEVPNSGGGAGINGGGGSGSANTSHSPTGSTRAITIDYLVETKVHKQKSMKLGKTGTAGIEVAPEKITNAAATHDNLEYCQRKMSNNSSNSNISGINTTETADFINVTANPMETAAASSSSASTTKLTLPRATIVVQQPSLSLDNTVETVLIKNEGEFISVESSKDLIVSGGGGNAPTRKRSQQLQHTPYHMQQQQQQQGQQQHQTTAQKQQKHDENIRQLLDVTNARNEWTFEELRDFEMRYGSPHHNRSQSVKAPGRASGRPNQLCLPQQRLRIASMPNTGTEEEYYRLRHFSITGKGIVNRGDSLKSRRSRSNNSVASSNSSTEHLSATQVLAPSSARNSANCSLASSRESSTSNPGSGPFKVLMLGGSAVGKSSLVSQFMTSEYLHAYDTSIDDDSGEKSVSVLLNQEESELTFIDHAYTEMNPDDCLNNYDNPHGYCVIYSSSDRSSFVIAEHILQVLWTNQNIAQKAVILVSNKSDLARSRIITPEEGKAMATAYDCKFIETSVSINHNVDELLVGLLSQIRLKLENPEKSRDLFRKRSIRKSKRRTCSPLGGACITGGTIPNTPVSANAINTPPGSAQSSPRKYRGSRTSTSLKVKGLLGRVWARDSKSKSCENLHVL